ncbi:23S ribosomal RNA methyltransferase Erm [Glycomyces buryatensis]|uniref:23S ribosomal RNA methyltransferase Erm n=1 Tax=Glycomyces buryatensis TaxID=2570927 RepID=A0A4S8Q3F9_9ACTN|nr:23S ribosomal RNA methyltransferase Erm [Glycomyces buryatensis]THV38658.1 23S ribosomal RNA methyltransferase Erm [Glycomyces buryatensis]
MSRKRSYPHARETRTASTRKRLSQNFLTDPAVARSIVRDSGVGPDDLVLEVGPGDGMITRHLLPVAGHVLAYEKDRHYVERLRRRYAGEERLRCFHADFRDVREPSEAFAVVANAPFSITTDIVRWCLGARNLTSATLVTQIEFARKHSGDFGRWTKLAVSSWPETTLELGRRIGRGRFHPVPQVDAAVLHLERRDEPLLPRRSMGEYRRLVELGFTGVGGSLPASLRRAYPSGVVGRACARAGIARDEPVGFVDPERWLTLFRVLP